MEWKFLVVLSLFVFLWFYLVGRVSHILLVSVFARMQASTILPLHLHQVNYKAIDSQTSWGKGVSIPVKWLLPLFCGLWQSTIGKLIIAFFFKNFTRIQMGEQHPHKAEITPVLLWHANSDIPLSNCMKQDFIDTISFHCCFYRIDRLMDFKTAINSCDYLVWPILLQEP